ncbi:methyl-accepting chemotaxis protein [Terasakiella brassicae]|uniref:Methyl-accepting chemotaxis protein n=1 Tax=Terasakiella brassicae TaxID=1634917 RepID=A0A917FES8_9PROT|nr:methyl-accepting chemotaxis protein [Terasakiella brassicae]GGF76656.1 methyl-accepting chemotaxis protein [Terasakiella brassicae]
MNNTGTPIQNAADDDLNLDREIGFGIGKRLLLAFGSVGLLCVLVSFVSWNGLNQLSETQNAISEEKVPVIISSLILANQTSQLVASAPLLSSASTDEERQAHMDTIEKTITDANQGVSSLAPLLKDKKQAEALQAKLQQIPPLVTRMNEIVRQMQQMEARRNELGKNLISLREISQKKLDPMTSGVNISMLDISEKWLTYIEQVLEQVKAGQEVDLATTELEMAPLEVTKFLKAVLGFKSGANLLIGMLLEGSQSETAESLQKVEEGFLQSIASMASPLSVMAQSQDVPELEKLFQELLTLGSKGDATNNILKLRREQLKLRNESDALLNQARDVSSALSVEVDKIVADLKNDMDGAVAQNHVSAQKTMIALVVVTVISILVVILVGWFYVLRNLVKRLMILVRGMQQIARGDLSTRVNRNGSDEISMMGSALALLRNGLREADELKKAQEEQQKRAEEEKKAQAQKLADDFDMAVGQSLSILSESLSDIRNKAVSMNEISRHTLSETQEVTQASQVMTQDISSVAANTEELSRSITEISGQVANSSQVANEAVSRAANLNNNIERLKEGSEKIESVIGLINTIAEQTNLLALNATIEASRAGEAGKGFAVVASEVKNLANQTASAIDNISELIGSIQNEIAEAVEANAQITTIISDIDQLSAGIAAAVEEQSAATAEISRTVQNTATHVNTISERVVDVADAIKNNDEKVSEVLEGVSSIDDQSSKLNQEVETFLDDMRKA